jgi:deferrochelatase/peroxidase EfeB
MTGFEQTEIQGLLRSGYGGLRSASYLLLRVSDKAHAKKWLSEVKVTTYADLDTHVNTALQIGFTAAGLRAMGLSEDALAEFAAEFVSGMAGDETRSRQLGDTGRNAPANWTWGVGDAEPHAVVMLFAAPGDLYRLQQSITTASFDAGFVIIADVPTVNLQDFEPFGFFDGISQPKIDWKTERTPNTDDDLEYGNLISLGEFVLGYENEYGRFTPSPSIAAAADRTGALLPAASDSSRRDLGRNGSYCVFRQLEQDVLGFWRFVTKDRSFADAERLASAMVGRTRAGAPLAEIASHPIRGVDPDKAGAPPNSFTYHADGKGERCPFGAHIRRSNPRNADMPGGKQGLLSQLLRQLGLKKGDPREDLIASSRFHRVLRRGREYGAPPTPEQALQPGAFDPGSGLNFLCLNASISRQFEFVQSAWIMNSKFDGMTGETDPLLGNREKLTTGDATDRFNLPQTAGPCAVIDSIPQFVTVKGGAYFFLPSIRALRFLAVLE